MEDEEHPMKRRMLRKASKKRRNPSKKRRANPSARKRRRRNEDAPKKARKPAVRRTTAELAAYYRGLAEKADARAAKPAKAKKGRPEGYGAKTRAARLRRIVRAAEKDATLIRTLERDLQTEVAAKMVERKKAADARAQTREAKKLASRAKVSRRTKFARLALAKGSKASQGSKAVARAWRAAKNAQKKAKSPKEQRLLRAMGLAGVPNAGGTMADLKTLLPQMIASAASLGLAAVAGQAIASKVVPADKQDSMIGKAAPSLISLTVGGIGWWVLRRSPKTAKFAPWVLAGGVAATVVHAIARITVKDAAGAPTTLAKRFGLPFLGEYAAMAGYGEYAAMAGLTGPARDIFRGQIPGGMGEYAAMAGGTAYSGERGIFAGLDDVDPVLSGTDDEDEIDFTETLADEGVNADEGSLNGSIFD